MSRLYLAIPNLLHNLTLLKIIVFMLRLRYKYEHHMIGSIGDDI